MVTVEEAGLDRLDELVAWRMETLHEVFDVPADQPMEELEKANRAYFEREIPCGGHISCFAEEDGRVVGCGGACLQHEMPSPDNPSGVCGYLMSIYTRPEHQGKGVGTAVVEWLVAKAKRAGAGKVYLETTEAGRPVYTRVGFTDLPDMMILRKGA